MKMNKNIKYLLIAVIVLAAFFRFWQINHMPGGLFPDEAANGLDINLMQQGHLQPFYERGNGREALFFYMLWASVAIFGKGPWQHHIVSALVGLFATIFTFYLTRKLILQTQVKQSDADEIIEEKNNNKANWIALISAFFMASSSWYIVLSRTAFRANLIPLFTTLTFLGLLCYIRTSTKSKQYIYAILTGTFFALGFYTYIAYRIMVPLIFIAVLWPIAAYLWQKPLWANIKTHLTSILFAGIAFIIVISPIAHYFYTHPDSFVGRSGQVSVFNPELNNGNLIGTITEVTRASLTAYFMDGDLNWRHNISGAGFLPIMISPFFVLGLILCFYWAVVYALSPIKKQYLWPYFLLTGWFWSMLIPVITTAEGIPHGLRSIGTIPVIFIMSAIGLWKVYEIAEKICNKFWAQISTPKQKLLTGAKYALIIVYVLSIISYSYVLYFVKAANSPENFYAFRSDLTVVSDYLKVFGNKNNTYLILDKFSVQTVEYFTSHDPSNANDPQNQPYIQVDPEDSWKLNNLKNGDQIVFTQSSIFDIKKFKQYHPEAKLMREDRNKFNQTVLAVYIINFN